MLRELNTSVRDADRQLQSARICYFSGPFLILGLFEEWRNLGHRFHGSFFLPPNLGPPKAGVLPILSSHSNMYFLLLCYVIMYAYKGGIGTEFNEC